jgi:inosine/xanthosine triphosphatase
VIIYVGSTNPVKRAAAAAVLGRVYDPAPEVRTVDVPSGVPDQPWGDEQTARGALNRARAAVRLVGAALGVGFEGGLLEVDGQLYTSAWCAVVRNDGTTGLGGGANLLLPPAVAAHVRAGAELGPAMDRLTGQHNTKHDAGAIGILTDRLLDRQSAYEHLLKLALARLLTPQFYDEGSNL